MTARGCLLNSNVIEIAFPKEFKFRDKRHHTIEPQFTHTSIPPDNLLKANLDPLIRGATQWEHTDFQRTGTFADPKQRFFGVVVHGVEGWEGG
jgi:hypothetical protein